LGKFFKEDWGFEDKMNLVHKITVEKKQYEFDTDIIKEMYENYKKYIPEKGGSSNTRKRRKIMDLLCLILKTETLHSEGVCKALEIKPDTLDCYLKNIQSDYDRRKDVQRV
jgi:hypothetical protein